MEVGAAKLAVGDAGRPSPSCKATTSRIAASSAARRSAREISPRGRPFARGEQRRRPQEAADMIGAKRRTAPLGHGRSVLPVRRLSAKMRPDESSAQGPVLAVRELFRFSAPAGRANVRGTIVGARPCRTATPARMQDSRRSLHPAYASTLARSPREPLVGIPQTLTEITGPDDWDALMGPAMADLTTQHAGAPIGQRIIVSGRVLDEAGRPVPAHRDRDLAGQRRRPLRPRQRPVGRAARSELHRRRPRGHRRGQARYRYVTVAAGRLSVEEPSQRLAAGPHPPLAARSGVRDASGRRRCISRTIRCSPSIRSPAPRPSRYRRRWWPLRSGDSPSRAGRSAICFDIVLRGPDATPAEAEREPGQPELRAVRPDALADAGPVLPLRPAVEGAAPTWSAAADIGARADLIPDGHDLLRRQGARGPHRRPGDRHRRLRLRRRGRAGSRRA